MRKPSTKEAVLAHLRCIRARANLVLNEVDFIGIAVRDELMTPAAAESFIEIYGLDYMQLAGIEASRQAFYSGADGELPELIDAEEIEEQSCLPERKAFDR